MFKCDFCEAQFITQDTFEAHSCRQRERMQELSTSTGVLAYKHYSLWFKKRKLLIPNKESFVVSRYYKTFFSFTKFTKKMGVPDVDLYIGFMARENILPQHWSNPDIYNYFLDYFDNECKVTTHLRITIKTMERLASILECKLDEVFDNLDVDDCIKLIQSRNFSPWVLLLSSKFKTFISDNATNEQLKLIEEVMKVNRWKTIMEKNRDKIKTTKQYIHEFNL